MPESINNVNNAPLLYSFVKDGSALSETEIQDIRYIFNAYEMLKSLHQVVYLLDYKHIRPYGNIRWSADTVRNILNNSYYCHPQRENIENNFISSKELKSLSPIVTEKQFEICQQILKRQYPGSPQTRQRINCHVFSGIVFCGLCGKAMAAREGRKKEVRQTLSYYSCLGKRNKTCDSRYVSEILIGDFLFNYAKNLWNAFNNLKEYTSPALFEASLLSGFPKNNLKIEYISLLKLYESLRCNFFDFFSFMPFQPVISADMLSALKANGWSDNGHNYIYKTQDRVTYLNELLSSNAYIDYSRLINKVNPWILKEFICKVFLKVVIEPEKIISIMLKNGMTQKFLY